MKTHQPKGQRISNQIIETVECSREHWPFQRRSTAWLVLCLLGGLLTARGQDPRITNTNNPADTNVSVGATVNFVVSAFSTNNPITRQWYHNGTNLLGATNATLVITNVGVAHAGGYQATVWNASGAYTNSRTAILSVDPTFTQITTGVLVTDTVGGWNASWIDYDGDGNLDLSVAPGGDRMTVTPLYHNEGNGVFRKVTTNAIGLTAVQTYAHVWADYDNDGKLDLFVPNIGTMNDMLFHNNGNGAFTRITSGHPVIDAARSMVGAWSDYDRDGFLDLFVAMGGWPPDNQNDLLYRSNGDGTFRKMTAAEVGPVVSDSAGDDITAWADVDNDGWPELFRNVSNSSIGWTNQLYHLDSQGKFYLIDIGDMKRDTGGYSAIAWADYDNDGFLDGLVWAETGLLGLYRNLAGQGFTNVAASAFPSSLTNCWAIWPGDHDNDGWQDLLIGFWALQPTAQVLYRNNGDGTFTSRNVGGPSSALGSQTWGDYNNDGFLDVLVLYGANTRNSLFKHNGNINHWLKVKLVGTASNRDGIGAKVRVHATIGDTNFWQMREISGQGIGVDNGLLAHFGLGDATSVTTLRIEWPSGIVQELPNVAANQFLTVVESQSYVGASPQFGEVTSGSGGLQLSFAEPAPNARYILEASNDMVNWTKLMARTSAGGTAQFTDTHTTNYTSRFYRLQVP